MKCPGKSTLYNGGQGLEDSGRDDDCLLNMWGFYLQWGKYSKIDFSNGFTMMCYIKLCILMKLITKGMLNVHETQDFDIHIVLKIKSSRF